MKFKPLVRKNRLLNICHFDIINARIVLYNGLKILLGGIFMKKGFSLFIALVFLISAFPMNILAEEDVFGGYYGTLFENFEGEFTDFRADHPFPKSNTVSYSTTDIEKINCSIVNDDKDRGRVLKYEIKEKLGGGRLVRVEAKNPLEGGQIVVELKIKLNEARRALVWVGGKGNYTGQCAQIYLNKDMVLCKSYNTDDPDKVENVRFPISLVDSFGDITANEWNDFKAIFDFNKRTYDLYWNGKKLGGDVLFRKDNSTPFNSVATVCVGADTDAGAVAYFDDIKIYSLTQSPPEVGVLLPFTRMNYETMQMRFTGTMSTEKPGVKATATVFSPSGKKLGSEDIISDENAKFTYYFNMPENPEDGLYTLKVDSGEFAKTLERKFQYIKPEKNNFSDVLGTPYERAALILSQLGIFTGYEDGTFKPDNTITRAEFAALLVRMQKFTERAEKIDYNPFDDTQGHWSAGNIAVGAEEGLINGYGDGNFGPSDFVTYEQAVKMLVAALGYGSEAEAAGGYPAGYTAKAETIGLTKDVNVTDNKATRGIVASLFKNALLTALKGEGINLLNKNFEAEMDEIRFNSVVEMSDNILTYGKDVYGSDHSPLFANGVDVYTMEPVVWILDGRVSLLSNLTSQQNMMRVFEGLSNLTGDMKYKNAAIEAIKYMFDNYSSECGLLYMGGHKWVDIMEEEAATGKGNHFELKDMFPHYSLMYEANPVATEKLIKATWNALMENWSEFEITRHGKFKKTMGELWNSEFTDPPAWKISPYLSFEVAGNDLVWAGAMLYKLTGDQGAWEWTKRVTGMYEKARHPVTGYPASLFTLPKKSLELPENWETMHNEDFYSSLGDRANLQMGDDFGDEAREGWMSNTGMVADRGINHFAIYDMLGEDASLYKDISLKSLTAIAKYQYEFEGNKIKPILANGYDLRNYTLNKNGYYGAKGKSFSAANAPLTLITSFALGYKHSKDETFWSIARNAGQYNDLGDLGRLPGVETDINFATTCYQPEIMFGIMELYNATGNEEYLKLAKAIGNNLYIEGFINGFYMKPNGTHYTRAWQYTRTRAKFDDYDFFAQLTLEGIIRGESDKVPVYNAGFGENQDTYDGGGSRDFTNLYSGQYDIQY
jgi:pectate lyase